jgi:hypothetical protein
MFRIYLFSLALCLISVPCFAESVTLDFLAGDPLPEWITVDRGIWDAGLGISNRHQNPDGVAIHIRPERPFTIDTVTVIGGQEFLYLQPLGGVCENQPPGNFEVLEYAPHELEYGCYSHSGRNGYSFYGDQSNDGENTIALTGLKLTLTDPVPFVTGDTDYDADADLMDLNNIRNNFGGDPLLGFGDVDRDDQIGLADLNIMRNNFGASASFAPVPEPSTIVLLAVFAAITAPRILRTRRPR